MYSKAHCHYIQLVASHAHYCTWPHRARGSRSVPQHAAQQQQEQTSEAQLQRENVLQC